MIAQRKSKLVCKAAAFVLLATAVLCCNLFLSGKDVYTARAEVDENGFDIQDGVLIGYSGNATEVVIPDSVTSIGESAFEYCGTITSITIPNSVTSIGKYAFFFCDSLTSITIPNGVASIESNAFAQCHSLTDIMIPESVTSIGSAAFHCCLSLTNITIPNSVTSIEMGAFCGCESLTGITIPEGVISIGEEAFFDCYNLTSITIPESVTSIESFAFYGIPEDAVFYVVKGSYAEEYVLKREVNFKYTDKEDISLDTGNLTVEDNNGFVVIKIEDGVQNDGQVYLITYELYDEEGVFAGTIRHYAGAGTGTVTWLAANGSMQEVNRDWSYAYGNNGSYGDSFPVTMLLQNISWLLPEANYNVYKEYTYKVISREILTEKLEQVETIAWDTTKAPGWVVWEPVEGAEAYVLLLKRDGVVYHTYTTYSTFANMAPNINKSGTYVIDIQACANGKAIDSDFAREVLTYEYVLPEEKLEAPKRVWWTAKEGSDVPTIANWTPVVGAKGYIVWLNVYDAEKPNGDRITAIGSHVYNNGNNFGTTYNLDWSLERFNNEALAKGMTYVYRISVQALSGNIELLANATEEGMSGEYKTQAALKQEFKDSLLADGLDKVIEDSGIEKVADAMMNDAAVLAEVAAAEQQHMEAKGVIALEPVSTVDGIDADNITVVGAGLNVEGGTVGLVLKEADSKIRLNSDLYHNVKQLDISLTTGNGIIGDLKVPVVITMDAPDNIAPDRLVILHAHNGEIEMIYPTFNEDGTMTFSVTGFSTFAFAGITLYDENGKEDIENSGDFGDEPDAIEAFVTRMYRIILEREPDAGSSTWINGLKDGSMTGVRVADGFVLSEEMLNKDISSEEFVKILYRAFFGREADAEGLATWKNLLDAGCKKTYVFAGFANSTEFGTLCAEAGIVQGRAAEYLADRQTGLSDADYKVWCFVERMYMEVLNRTADEPGVRSWVGALQDGSMTGVEVADGFIMSEEFLAKNMTDEEYVRIMYRAFFGRDADVEGLATWTNALATGWTKQEVFAGFANSNEFGVLCGQAGIVQGTAEGK